MSLEITGIIIASLPIATGQGKNGTWKNQDHVLETADQYPKKICFNIWGDDMDKYPIEIGQQVAVSINLESREYNGRWYTTAKAWKIITSGNGVPAGNNSYVPPVNVPAATEEDNLPF